MPNVALRPDWRFAAAVIGALTLWRLIALGFDRTDLWVDEAQYWLWSQNLDWGYFSKPPMIAFWLRAVTDLAGSDSAFWIRASGSVLHALTAGLIGLSAARLFDPRIGAWAAMIYATAPFVTLGSWLFSTDTMMLPFFALALYAWLRLRDGRSLAWAVICGAAIGAGFLSKYAVIYLPISLALASALIPGARIAWRDAGIVALTALVVSAPNILWNVATGGTTVRHIAEDNAKLGSATFDLAKMGEFLASQFVVFGPILFAAILSVVWLLIRRQTASPTGFLVILSLTVVILLSIQAARAGANANWAVTAYVAGSILAASVLISHPRLLMTSFVLHLVFALAFPVAFMAADTIRLPGGRLLAERYVGPSELSLTIADTADKAGLSVIVAERRGVLADLFHTLRDRDFSIFAVPPDALPRNYYQQVFPLPAGQSGDVLLATSGDLPCPEAVEIGQSTAEDGIYRDLTFRFYEVAAACLRAGS
ncbi:MAG: glycosyltransferase family 39 protein [Alphaproteobacteria bacterium]|nr:glycosyltransferase family 39 protein [Alphaproteobacteria bacterium]